MNKKISDKKGFTLLFAILVSIMILAVGASIINIALKQVVLSGAGRESQFAFYAANTGLECALYWDLNGSVVNNNGSVAYVFPPSSSFARINETGYLDCAGTNIANGNSSFIQQTYTKPWDITQSGKTVFRIALANTISNLDNILYCAEVTVGKEIDSQGRITTTITSQGLNSCEPENDARAVQRGLVLQYRS